MVSCFRSLYRDLLYVLFPLALSRRLELHLSAHRFKSVEYCQRTFKSDIVTIENSAMTWSDARASRSDVDEESRVC